MSEISEAIARKVRALLSRTTEAGFTEAEAIEAAVKARELMDCYRVTLTDVEITAEPIVTELVDRPNAVRWAAGDYTISGIRAWCGVAIAVRGGGRSDDASCLHFSIAAGNNVRHCRDYIIHVSGLDPDLQNWL